MSATVIKFYPNDAAKNPDSVLEQAIGAYNDVFILGYGVDGELQARASKNLGDASKLLFILEQFKVKLVNGDYTQRGDC